MPIHLLCPKCGHYLEAEDGDSGEIVSCAKCNSQLIVPNQPNAAADGSTTRLLSSSALSDDTPIHSQAEIDSSKFRFYCPTCGGVVQSSSSAVGEKVFCPHCNQKLEVPQPLNKTVLGSLQNPQSTLTNSVVGTVGPPPPAESIPVVYAVSTGTARTRSDDATTNSQYSFRCPMCRTHEPPIFREEISQEGWILFVVLLLFFFPLCWLPFLTMKRKFRQCYVCGTKLN